MGKSGGSLIQQGLVFLFGNILNAAPAVFVIYNGVLLTWLSAANTLSGLFMAKTEMQKAEKYNSSQQ
jgi:AAA family ATP:ADP antiporter